MPQKPHQLIKTLRTQNGYSQAYLAKKLKLSRPTYLLIEKGEREPTLSQMQTLADLFGITPNTFFTGKITTPKYSVEFEEDKEDEELKGLPPVDIRISVPQKNMKKFKEVLLYILQKVGAKPNVGETVLYKLLYFIDFDYYEKFEEQLIGATYIKNHHGPTPVEFKKLVEKMIKAGELERVRSKYFQYEQKKYLPLRPPQLNQLSAQEKVLIDEVLDRLSDKSAKELSDYSHGDIPWVSHEKGEEISYESVFYRGDAYSVKEYDDEL